jgi:hypothetical protein
MSKGSVVRRGYYEVDVMRKSYENFRVSDC